jgi:GNAT superfamily N-acetyltransferase
VHREEDVVRLAQRCLVEVLKETARRCGGAAVEQHGLLLVAGNHPCPVLVNSVLRTGTMVASEVLGRAEAFFGERGHHYETWTRNDEDADIERAALAAGMRFAAELTGMVLHGSPDVPELGPSVEIRRVEDIHGLRDFTNVVAEGFRDEAPGLSDLVRSIFSRPDSIIAPDTAAFVVWDRGQPASAAMTMVKEGVAWIGWVATRSEARGRGLGRLATAAATRAGFTLGARFASLEATTMGAPVYLRLGYEEVVRYRNYWPADFQG